MPSVSRRPSWIPASWVEDVEPALAVQGHQVALARNPAAPIQAFASCPIHLRETAGRPIRLWSLNPGLARDLNNALAEPAEK